jgi:succinoglycan biosynthesis transport protein ExoP
VIPSTQSLTGRRGRVYGLLPRPSEVQQDAHDGQVPVIKALWPRIDVGNLDYTALSEAFRSLRTSVLLSAPDHPPVTILVTSAKAAEGKTTVSSNLAIALAQLGQRVLILDADMRRASLHKLFALENDLGLVSFLTGHQEWHSAVQETAVPNLDCLVAGPIPPNPAELLSSQRMRTLLREVAREFTFVIVDSPPLLNLADSRVLSTLVDGVVLVVKGGETPRDVVRRAQTSIRDVGANIIGLVLNNLDIRTNEYGYDNYYGYSYGHREDGEKKADKTSP